MLCILYFVLNSIDIPGPRLCPTNHDVLAHHSLNRCSVLAGRSVASWPAVETHGVDVAVGQVASSVFDFICLMHGGWWT